MLNKWSMLVVATLGLWLAPVGVVTDARAASVFVMGPSGGTGGDAFSDSRVNPRFARVSEVRVRHGSWIDGVQVFHELDNGQVVSPGYHGGKGGRLSRFRLRPGEFIASIRGRYGRFVDSIVLRTNRGRTFSTGGKGGQVNYVYTAPSGYEIVGFHGRNGVYLDSIGVVLRER